MTLASTAPATETPRTPEAEPTPRARFTDLVASEWIKVWSLRSTAWTIAVGTLAIIGFNVFTAYDDYTNWPAWSAQDKADFAPNWAMLDSFTDAALLCLLLVASAMGSLSVVGEYSTGQIRTTFTAVPDRSAVMAAKVVVVTVVTTGFGLLAAGGSFWSTQAILSGRGTGVSLGDPGVLSAFAACVLAAPLAALVGMAVGAVIRASAATMGTSFALLLLVPMGVSDDRYTSAVIDHTLPYSAWARLMQITEKPAHYPWSAAGAWTVYAVWAVVAAAVAIFAVKRRDQ
ncbi:ABC transporter permease [Streptomyces sp. NPDC001515]